MNEKYFDTIDTEDKAYWLGFIATDGCVIGDRCLAINLSFNDDRHLQKFLDAIGAPNNIYYAINNYSSVYCQIRIISGQIVSDLNKLGIHNRKTFTVKPWDGPTELMKHYWRGCVDGDGWVSSRIGTDKYHTNIRGIGFCGNKAMVEGFQLFLKQFLDINAAITPDKSIFKLYVGGIRGPKRVAELLYGGCKVSLDRKLKLAETIIATNPKTIKRDLKQEDIIILFDKLGGWSKVAEALKMKPSYLRVIRKRLGLAMDERWSKQQSFKHRAKGNL